MALTFSYKILDASGGLINDQIIEVATNGSAVDQARQYRLGLYAAYDGPSDINLVSSDVTLGFSDYLVSAPNAGGSTVEFSSDFNLFRSSAIASTNGLTQDDFTTIENRTLNLSLNQPVAKAEANAKYYEEQYQNIFNGLKVQETNQRNAELEDNRISEANNVYDSRYSEVEGEWQDVVETRLNSVYSSLEYKANGFKFSRKEMNQLIDQVQDSADKNYSTIETQSSSFVYDKSDGGYWWLGSRRQFSEDFASRVVDAVQGSVNGLPSVHDFLRGFAEDAKQTYIKDNPINYDAPLSEEILDEIAAKAAGDALAYVDYRLSSDIESGAVNSYQSAGLWALNGSPLGFDVDNYVEELDGRLVLKSEYIGDLAFADGRASFAFDETVVTAEVEGTIGTLDSVRFSQGAAGELGGELGDGLLLGSGQGERFLGSVLLDINDSFFKDSPSYLANTLKGTLGDYLALSFNQDETILVSDGIENAPAQIRSLRDLGGYEIDAGSLRGIQSVSGSFLVDASLQGKLGTTLETTTQSGRFTNLLRVGQKLSTSIDIFNDGKAGLQDVAFDFSSLELSDYSLDSVTTQRGRANWSSPAGAPSFEANGTAAVDQGATLSGGLGSIDRSRDAAGLLDLSGDDAVRIGLNLTVSGDAGDVAAYSSNGGIQLSARGVSSEVAADHGSVKNLITYQGDLNYDGKVGMRDLAALNEGARLAKGGAVNADVDANFDGSIDLNDLAALANDWGESLWSQAGGGSEFLGEGPGDSKITDGQLATQVVQGESLEWDNTPFTLEGNLVAGGDVVAAQGSYPIDNVGSFASGAE